MPYERTGYAPWSLTREAGVQSATVDGTIQVPQYIQPTLSTGFIDENGTTLIYYFVELFISVLSHQLNPIKKL